MEFFDALINLFSGTGVLSYVLVFLGEFIYILFFTMRIMLINRGERLAGALLSLVEVTFWVIVTGTVVNNLRSDLFKLFFYVVAFTAGCFAGSLLEERLALGLSSITIFAPDESAAERIAAHLRENNFAVTVMDGEGMEHARRFVLTLIVRRKANREVVHLVRMASAQAVITISDISSFRGGYLKKHTAARKTKI